MATLPRWAGVPRFLYSRAGARWIVAAVASVSLVGYMHLYHGWLQQGGVGAGLLVLSGFTSPATATNTPTPTPTPTPPPAAAGYYAPYHPAPAPGAHLPAWIDTPAPFTITDDTTPATASLLHHHLALDPRLLPAVEAFLARPVLSHEQAKAVNEVQCPRAQLETQVNQDQLSNERDSWTTLTAENVTTMRHAAVAFLERRSVEEGPAALVGPGFGPNGVTAVEVGSRGVVLAAGNQRTVERAVVCVKELRRLGWTGGVEVWHFEGELQGEADRAALKALGIGVHEVRVKKAPGQWKNFELKAEAVLRSSFDEVLYLDSDNFPLADIERELFEAALFTDPRGGRAVFWPDLNRDHPDNAIHRVLGIPCHEAWQLDSGQMVIAKSGNGGLNLAALYLAMFMQTEGGYWFSGGDKDTFRYAFLALGIPYTPAPRWLAVLGNIVDADGGALAGTPNIDAANDEETTFCGAAMLQYGLSAPPPSHQDPADPSHPAPLFVHANLLKHMSGVAPGEAFPMMRRLALTQDDVRQQVAEEDDGENGGAGAKRGPLDAVVGGARTLSDRGLCSDIWAFGEGALVETVDARKAFGGLLDGFEERYGVRAGAWKR